MKASHEARLAVRVTPRGGRDSIDAVRDGELHLRVAAAPADGAANLAVTRLVASALGIPPTAVRVASGGTGRRKILAVTGLDRAALIARWPDLGV